MVKKTNELFQCEKCSFSYREKSDAEQCEEWCRKHKSCNLDLIKKAVQS